MFDFVNQGLWGRQVPGYPEATRGLPTQSTHPLIVLSIAVTLIVVPATSGLAGSTNADTAPASDADASPYDGLAPAIEDRFGGQDDISFAEAIELGKLAGEHQAATFGIELAMGYYTSEHKSPSQAAIALADLQDVRIEDGQREDLEQLEQVDEPVRGALTDTIDAFIAFHLAADAAYGDLERLGDHGGVSAARSLMLDGILDLATAVDSVPHRMSLSATCDPIVVAPAVALDLEGCDSTYTEDVALSIDLGGEDTYENNAGGARYLDLDHVVPVDLPPGAEVHEASAFIDLGSDDDQYQDPTSPGRLAVNGGGLRAAGFLLDEGGNDTYSARCCSSNGGGWTGGSGFLLDVSGNDTYNASEGSTPGSQGVNGGGYLLGSGTLLDLQGNDTYTAGSYGINGGGFLAGSGLLVDLDGNDEYTAGIDGVNGQGVAGGEVFIRGVSPYAGTVPAVASTGLLFDGGGTDEYDDGEGGTGPDKTVVPKGFVGAQIDH